MRITLVGSRHFGVTTLEMLRQRGADVVRVVVADAEDRLASAPARRSPPNPSTRGEFRDFFRKTVEALQPLVFFLDVAAVHYPVCGRRFRFGLRRYGGVVAIETILGLVIDFETGQKLLGHG